MKRNNYYLAGAIFLAISIIWFCCFREEEEPVVIVNPTIFPTALGHIDAVEDTCSCVCLIHKDHPIFKPPTYVVRLDTIDYEEQEIIVYRIISIDTVCGLDIDESDCLNPDTTTVQLVDTTMSNNDGWEYYTEKEWRPVTKEIIKEKTQMWLTAEEKDIIYNIIKERRDAKSE